MRILAVGNMYPPHHQGGYEIVWRAAMRRARERGHEVRVLTTDHREPGVAEAELDPGVHRELEMYWSWEAHDWRPLGPRDKLRLERHNRAVMEGHVRDFGPDVVCFWAMGAMSMSLVERAARGPAPSVLCVHDDWLVYGPRRDGWLRLWAPRRRRPLAAVAGALTGIPTRFSPRRPERVLPNSEFILGRARAEGLTLPDAEVITPGIESRFLEGVAPAEWGWRLLCAGRLDRQKGTDVAIEALADLPEAATLTIAGSGDPGYAAELRALAERLGVAGRVEFAGQVGHDRLPALYAAADAFLFPVRWEEPFGLVPLEAMGIGRPVVATARGGAAEYLRDGENALVVEAGDPAALAAAVRRLAGDEDLRERLRAGGAATAARNTSARFEDRVVDELEAAAASRR